MIHDLFKNLVNDFETNLSKKKITEIHIGLREILILSHDFGLLLRKSKNLLQDLV